MRTIHKFPVNIGANHILLTAAAKLLTVQEKDQGLNLWVEYDPDDPMVVRTVELYGTGWKLPEKDTNIYLCTVQHQGYVWHAYETS